MAEFPPEMAAPRVIAALFVAIAATDALIEQTVELDALAEIEEASVAVDLQRAARQLTGQCQQLVDALVDVIESFYR